jgi:hypothetical protein
MALTLDARRRGMSAHNKGGSSLEPNTAPIVAPQPLCHGGSHPAWSCARARALQQRVKRHERKHREAQVSSLSHAAHSRHMQPSCARRGSLAAQLPAQAWAGHTSTRARHIFHRSGISKHFGARGEAALLRQMIDVSDDSAVSDGQSGNAVSAWAFCARQPRETRRPISHTGFRLCAINEELRDTARQARTSRVASNVPDAQRMLCIGRGSAADPNHGRRARQA